MLAFNNLALRRGSELLFKDVTFTIHRGNKVGLVGANGSGKTSLFEMILSRLEADEGSLTLPADTSIAHMAQEVEATEQPAIEFVLGGDSVYADVIEALALVEEEARFEDIALLHEKLDTVDGYSARARAEQLMAGLGFSPDESEKPLKSFSGGWRIRLSLARTLMQSSDLLLLDEPTNHLDLDAIIWLANWIGNYRGTLILVSHDREFLDECVDHIAYLSTKTIELFKGNYTGFEKIKAARLSEQQADYEKQQREIAHMQDFIRRFRAKATKAKQAQSRIKALERMELIAPAHVDSPFHFEIHSSEKTSTPLLVMEDADIGYEDPVLHNVNLSFHPGDRFGLLGVNGAGKSTLIKTICGLQPLLSGKRIEGTHLNVGYFSQHQLDELALAENAFDHIASLDRKMNGDVREQEIRDFLGGFNFRGDKVFDPVRTFSGGEKARLALSLITYTRPNLLLMDEPTNHLDIDMRQALTVALQSFSGALVLVSHDRHLMANTVDEFLLLEGEALRRFEGNLSDYGQKVVPATKPAKSVPQKKKPVNHKAARQLRTRLKTLDTRIERLARKLAEVENQMGDPDLYQKEEAVALQDLLRDQLELKEQLELLENEWLELNTQLESLDKNS